MLLGVVAVLARRLQRATLANRALRAARDQDAAALSGAQLALARVERQVGALQADATAAQRHRQAFLVGLSHDLRNPLVPLSNGLQLLRLGDHDPLVRQRSRLVIERQLDKLTGMADDVSEFARLCTGRATLQNAAFDLRELLLEAKGHLSPVQQEQGSTLAIGGDLSDPLILCGDSVCLGRAFGHLLQDLLRQGEPGAGVQMRVQASVNAVTVHLGVAGESPDACAASGNAQPNQDPDQDPAADVAASGLTLALAQQVIALHAGRLSVQRWSGARRGRFTVVLPRPPGVVPVAARSA